MADTDRLLGELKEFKRATLKELHELRKEIHALNQWKWKSTGFLAAVVGGFEMVKVLLEHQR